MADGNTIAQRLALTAVDNGLTAKKAQRIMLQYYFLGNKNL